MSSQSLLSKKEFYRPQHYLNLAEIYLIWGKKRKAMDALETGMNLDDSGKAAHRELAILGIRRKPVVPFLSRGNPINKYLGKLLSRICK